MHHHRSRSPGKTLTDKVREKRRRKRKAKNQRKTEVAANRKNEAARDSPFQLVDKTERGYRLSQSA